MPPGMRLKLDLSNLLEGGDAKKAEREKAEKRRKKRRNKFMGGWGGISGGYDSDWKTMWKEWVNEYTVTMDIKVRAASLLLSSASSLLSALRGRVAVPMRRPDADMRSGAAHSSRRTLRARACRCSRQR